MSFGDAFKRPFQDFKSLLIGIVIMIIPIVNFIGMGYVLRCAKGPIRRDFKLPVWERWGDLFVKGIVSTVIGIIYMIPAMIVFALTVGFALITGGLTGALSGTTSLTTLLPMFATAGIGLIATVVVAIIFGLLGNAAIIRYAEKETFGAAFEVGAIAKKAFTGTFFAAWLVGAIYFSILMAILSMIPYIGTAIAAFIGYVTFITLTAEAYGKV
jgi:hypothetical protein